MTTSAPRPAAIERYLEQLRHELRFARKGDREDYLEQIGEHLDESRVLIDTDDPRALDDLLDRLGPPTVLAKEFYVTERAKLSASRRALNWARRRWIGIAVGALIVGVVSLNAWANSYQPLSLNLNGGYFDNVTALSGHAPVKLSEAASTPFTWKLTDGRYRVSILFDALNTGSLAVTIAPPDLVPGTTMPVTWQLESATAQVLTPFRPFRLGGHQSQMIIMNETITCRPWPVGSANAQTDSTQFINDMPIVMSFWRHSRTVRLGVQPFYLELAGNCT